MRGSGRGGLCFRTAFCFLLLLSTWVPRGATGYWELEVTPHVTGGTGRYVYLPIEGICSSVHTETTPGPVTKMNKTKPGKWDRMEVFEMRQWCPLGAMWMCRVDIRASSCRLPSEEWCYGPFPFPSLFLSNCPVLTRSDTQQSSSGPANGPVCPLTGVPGSGRIHYVWVLELAVR